MATATASALPFARYELDAVLNAAQAGHRSGAINDATYAASFFLGWQIATHASRFASRRSRYDARPDAAVWWQALCNIELSPAELADLLERHQFLGVIPNATAALAAWLRADWSLQLCNDIPDALSLLRLQTAGTRVVTIVTDPKRRHRPIMHKSDAFAFMVHDLEHAFQFFHDTALHQLQRRFFAVLLQLVEQGCFADYCRSDAFSTKLNYVMSDMNTHPAHSVSYLRAILIEHCLQQEQLASNAALPASRRDTIERVLQPFAEFLPPTLLSSGACA